MAIKLIQTRIDNATTAWEKAHWMVALKEMQANQHSIDAIFARVLAS